MPSKVKTKAAIKKNNTLWTFGQGTSGQLANNAATVYSSPVQVGSLTDWKQVACGSTCTLAIKTTGQMFACGYNGAGQLGNGTLVSYSSPIQVGSLTNWKQVSAGANTTVGVQYSDIGQIL